MKLRDRFGFAWNALTGKNIKSVATLVPFWKEGMPEYSEAHFETMVRQGWRKNELIFACVDKTANTAAQVELKVKSKSGASELMDHPLKKLIQAPNPYMSEFDFWSAIIIYQKLGGRSAWEKVRSRGGQVVQLWPLRPDWLRPIPSSAKMISGYEYGPPGVEKATLAVQDVADFKLFDPINPYHPWPPANVAARIGDVDNSATDYIKLLFDRGGVPQGLLKSKQKLADTAVADIRRRWAERYGGYEKWGVPAVLDSDAEYQKTGFTFEEMGLEFLDARDEARVCMVMDIPAILVGAKIGLDRATYANYSEARLAWWEDSLTPLYTNFLDVIYNQVTPDFGNDIYCEWDFSRVWAFQEENSKIWQRALDAVSRGAITVNDFLAQVGLPSRGPAGDVYLRGIAVVEVPAKGSGKEAGGQHEHKELDVPSNAPDDEERLKIEAELAGKMKTYLKSQKKRLMEQLDGRE